MNRTASISGYISPLLHGFFALGLMVFILYQANLYGAVIPVEWLPDLDVSLSLLLDNFSLLFVVLICATAFCVHLYAGGYMKGYVGRASFHVYLTLFMLAMLGVVTANNIITLFIFWELTSLTSYMLIGFRHEDKTARRNALQAVLVTGAGGLCLLAGLILLGHMAGTYELDMILANAPAIASHDYFHASLILVLLGAFTKSAQFPFHFWLPNAMAAPTPVSALLHSATMVKAGVFLLARLMPIYAQSEYWDITLMTVGGVTAIWAAIVALRQTDFKLMLAYSTNVALGKLVFLLGLGTPYALSAALILILAHAPYKAALFMIAGTIDKKTGTRNIDKLYGLRRVMMVSFAALLLAALSKAGMIPFMGFVSKEYMYKAGLDVSALSTFVLLSVNMMMVAMALILVIKPFMRNPTANQPALTDKAPGMNILLWLPPLLLAVVGILLPVAFMPWLEASVIHPALAAISPQTIAPKIVLWQGFNAALGLSVLTLLGGVVLYLLYPKLKTAFTIFDYLPKADRVYDWTLEALINGAQKLIDILQHGRLRLYLMLFLSVLVAFMAAGVPAAIATLSMPSISGEFYEYALAVFIVLTLPLIIFAPSKVFAIVSLGVFGFLIALVFMVYSAPDVAKTQLLVETLLLIFLAIILRRLPLGKTRLKTSGSYKAFAAILSLTLGALVSLTLFTMNTLPFDTTLSDFYGSNSMLGGYGRNIVNVILVDFRALDTFGEIIVVVIACLAASMLLPLKGDKKKEKKEARS